MERFSFVWFLLLLSSSSLIRSEYDLSDDGAHGVRISGNDLFTVFARNSELTYEFSFAHYKSCETSYPIDYNYYVYSLAVVNNNNKLTNPPNFTFVQVAETMASETQIIISVLTVARHSFCHITSWYEIPIWNGTHQTYMQIKVDPQNQYAYVFADSFVLSFDISAMEVREIKSINRLFNDQYFPRAFDLTDTWAIVTGVELTHRRYSYASYLIMLQPLNRFAGLTVDNNVVDSIAKIKIYDRENDMSVAVNARRNMTLISFPARQRVLVIDVNPPASEYGWWTIVLKYEVHWPVPEMGFGRSLTWLNDETVAITMFTVSDRPWSRSEVWMFAVNKPFDKPLFVFPNNQQVVTLARPPLFLHILAWSNNLYVLTDQSKVLLIPTRPPGFLSVWSKSNDDVLVYKSAPCMAGTYKNTSSIGPCLMCPPQTTNAASETDGPSIECVTCPSNSFCPPGSVNVVELDALPSYVQTYSYPSSPDVDNYDDTLLQTIFELGDFSQCLFMLPTFWTLLGLGFSFIVWLILISLKSSKRHTIIQLRERAKTICKKMAPFNFNKHWISGLFSFSAVILLGFVYWFAFNYLEAYPIETANAKRCFTKRNSKFDNALQLPLPLMNGQKWKILEMLNEQQLIMSIDLVNTLVHCSNITVRQIIPRAQPLNIGVTECIHSTSTNATRSFTFDLPRHPTTVELMIYGPYFIGGIRFCLRGSGFEDTSGNTLRSLDVCQFYSAKNQTLGRTLTLSIVLIKTVNLTHPLKFDDNTLYHGRWTPTWNDVIGLSDELLWRQYGQHLRYASDRSTVSISVGEHPFFLQNNQQPIVRKSELIFHTLLFTSLVIEIFAIGFAVVKIINLSFTRFRSIRSRRHRNNNDVVNGTTDNLSNRS